MSTLRETTTLLHRAAPPGGGLPDTDLRRVAGWTIGLLDDLERLHRDRRWHGEIGPDAVRIRGDRARLDPPTHASPPEFRDPERERLRLMRRVSDPACESRHDVYGVGALLYSVLENGPPPCGAMSVLTRPVPPALAWIVSRAIAEGDARYPGAAAMRGDLDRLLRLARGRALADVPAEELPSFTPGAIPPPRRLVPYRKAVRRERRWTRVLVVAALVSVLALAAAWLRPRQAAPVARGSATANEIAVPTVVALLGEWREALDERLATAGEKLDPDRVPLLVISDVRLPRDLGWVRHPSARLQAEIRRIHDEDAPPAEIESILRREADGATIPAVLRVRPGPRNGLLDVTLDYRGVRYRGVATAR